MPKRLRFLLAWKPKLISLALNLFLRALFAWQRRCARKQGIKEPLCRAVTFIQRVGSALNLNIHFHTLFPEGVFFQAGQGGVGFHSLWPPSVSDLNKLLRRIILSLLKRLATQPALEEADAWMQTLAQSVRTTEFLAKLAALIPPPRSHFRSAARGTNQAPTALTAAAALLFSLHDGAPPAGEPGAGTNLYGRANGYHNAHHRRNGRAFQGLHGARYPHGSRKTCFVFPRRPRDLAPKPEVRTWRVQASHGGTA